MLNEKNIKDEITKINVCIDCDSELFSCDNCGKSLNISGKIQCFGILHFCSTDCSNYYKAKFGETNF